MSEKEKESVESLLKIKVDACGDKYNRGYALWQKGGDAVIPKDEVDDLLIALMDAKIELLKEQNSQKFIAELHAERAREEK